MVLCNYSYHKSLIYTLFVGIKLDRILIKNRNQLLTESENKIYKDQLSLLLNNNRKGINSLYMISVIIPTYKRANYIQHALKTVISQSFKNTEIIVVDDNGLNSKEQINTEQKVNEFIESNPNYCIRYFALEQNSGACFARNFGASISECTYISFLDDDDKWDSRKLESQFLLLELNQLSPFCFCKQILEKKGKAKHIRNFFYFGNISNKIIQGNYIGSSSNPLINKKYFDEICGFDINLPSCQDWDLWIRLMELATPLYLNKSLVVIDRNLTERISSNNLKVLLGHILLYSKIKTKYKKHKFSLVFLKLKILKRVFKVLFEESSF